MSDLERIHEAQLEILNEVDRICKKHGIKYFLTAGTLLGAVRHRGFIPWDDDIDIAMPRADYERFIEISQTEMSGNFSRRYLGDGTNYFFVFAKVIKTGTLFVESQVMDLYDMGLLRYGIFIDIFPIDNVKKNNFAYAARKRLVKAIRLINLAKMRKKFRKRLKAFIALFCKLLSAKLLNRLAVYLCTMDKAEDSKYVTSLGSYGPPVRNLYLRDKMFPLSRVEFEGRAYPAPGDWDHYLSTAYGPGYMELPPEEKRRTHAPSLVEFGAEEPDEAKL